MLPIKLAKGQYRQKTSKHRAIKTVYKDKKYDSKFEAGQAAELDIRKRLGEILDWERQYHVRIPVYRKDGEITNFVNHKVDFRIHELDGSFTLLEAKGQELADWRWRRDLLVNVWLHEHPDHTYLVVKDAGRRRSRSR